MLRGMAYLSRARTARPVATVRQPLEHFANGSV